MKGGKTPHAQNVVHMFFMQQRQQPSDRDGPHESAGLVEHRHVGIVLLDGEQGHGFRIVAGSDDQRRIPT
jgi:hypothetical protein